MGLLLFAVLLGLIPAVVAQRKGHSFIGFWIYGALLLIVALPHALLMKANAKGIEARQLKEGGRKCPHCAEVIKSEALVCRFCGRDVPQEPKPVHVVQARGEAIRCLGCGSEMSPFNITCPQCGRARKDGE